MAHSSSKRIRIGDRYEAYNPAYGRSVLIESIPMAEGAYSVGLMLGALEEADASKRKLWLFQSARYRHVWPCVHHDIRRIIEAIERLAEGRATKRDFRTAAVETDESFDSVVGSVVEDDGGAADVAADTLPEVVVDPIHTDNVLFLAEKAAQCDLIRDIFGDPYRPVKADPAWLTPVVVQLRPDGLRPAGFRVHAGAGGGPGAGGMRQRPHPQALP